jgi:hypothetical protein
MGLPKPSSRPPDLRAPGAKEREDLPLPAASRVLPFPWKARRRPDRASVPPRAEPRDPDDYTLSNRALFGFALFLALYVTFGVWLLEAMRAQAKLEDCLMAGRKNCVPIALPTAQR